MIENFEIDKATVTILQQTFGSVYFPWFYNPQTITNNDRHQFVHTLYNENKINSSHYDIVRNLFDQYVPEFETHKLVRIKLNLNTPYKNNDILPPHKDIPFPGIVYIYYVYDSDGNTLFYDNAGNQTKSIEPKAGKLIKFPAHTLHSGQTPYESERKIVINFVFEE